MFIGYFTERPYQDRRSGYFGLAGRDITDLSMSNGSYDPASAPISTTATSTRRSTPRRWASTA